jgi:hypothetical protein
MEFTADDHARFFFRTRTTHDIVMELSPLTREHNTKMQDVVSELDTLHEQGL